MGWLNVTEIPQDVVMIGICPFFARATSSQPSLHPYKKVKMLILATWFESLPQKLEWNSACNFSEGIRKRVRSVVVVHQENNFQQPNLKDPFLKLSLVSSYPHSLGTAARKKEMCWLKSGGAVRLRLTEDGTTSALIQVWRRRWATFDTCRGQRERERAEESRKTPFLSSARDRYRRGGGACCGAAISATFFVSHDCVAD